MIGRDDERRRIRELFVGSEQLRIDDLEKLSLACVQGQVADSGGLRVVVGDGVRKANGSGKLSATGGSGTWSGGGGMCSGTWVAQRN